MIVTEHEPLARIFAALSSPIRMEILDILREERSVLELRAEMIRRGFDMAQAGISHHLKILKGAHLIEAHHEGCYHYYQLARPDILQHLYHVARCYYTQGEPLCL